MPVRTAAGCAAASCPQAAHEPGGMLAWQQSAPSFQHRQHQHASQNEISQACVDGNEPSLRLLQLCPQPHLAYGHDLDREGVLVVVRGVLLVVGDQLLVMAVPNGHHPGQEVNEFGGVGTLAKEKVDALKAEQAERRSAPSCWPAGWQAAPPSWSTTLLPDQYLLPCRWGMQQEPVTATRSVASAPYLHKSTCRRACGRCWPHVIPR